MRVLFATTSGAGHFGPLVPFARACLTAGHSVLVAGPPRVEPRARQAGLAFRAVPEPTAVELAAVSERLRAAPPERRLALAFVELYGRCYASAALPGMVAAIAEWRPDVVVRESAELSAGVAAQHLGVSHARVGIALSPRFEDSFFGMHAPALDELRATLGLGPDPEAAAARSAPCFTLAPPSLDDAGAPDPPWVRRYRADVDNCPRALPDWWEGDDAPLLYVSYGSEAASADREFFPSLYRATIDAVADLPVRVLITLGRDRDAAELGPLPHSVHVERWVTQEAVMPHAAAMVQHGGAGSTLAALAGGVPMALVPLFADQPINAGRVAEIGAGVALEGGADAVASLREVVPRLLTDPTYRAASERVADEIRGLPPIRDAVHALEKIAAGGVERVATTA